MKIMPKEAKIEVGLVGQTINNSNVTGRYFDMMLFRRILAVLIDGASADTKTTTLEFLQATALAGTGAKAITGATCTLTTPTKMTKLTAALATVLATQTLTITVTVDGVSTAYVFTAHATTTTKASRQFSIAGTDSQDADELISCINDVTYGVPGVTATNDNGTVTLTVTDPGSTTISVAQSAATFTFAQVEAIAYVDLDVSQLDIAGGFQFVAPKVTKTGNGIVAVAIQRYSGRFEPDQAVAASAIK